MKSADTVSRRVELEPGKDLLGDDGSADHLTPFQNQHLEPRPAQVGGSNEAVVARTDHDGVV